MASMREKVALSCENFKRLSIQRALEDEDTSYCLLQRAETFLKKGVKGTI